MNSSEIGNSGPRDQVAVNQESEQPVDPRLEIYLSLEAIYDSNSSDEDLTMDPPIESMSTTTKSHNRPPPPSQALYRSLINQSEHPMKPVLHSEGAYTYSEVQNPPKYDVKQNEPSMTVQGSSNHQKPLTMLERSLTAMKYVRDIKTSPESSMNKAPFDNKRNYQESMSSGVSPPRKNLRELTTSGIPSTTNVAPSKQHIPLSMHAGIHRGNPPSMLPTTTHQRPTLPISTPHQPVLPSAPRSKPPPPSEMFKDFQGCGPLSSNSQKREQYSNVPFSHLHNKTLLPSRLPSNQTASQLHSNQTTAPLQLPSNPTPSLVHSNQTPPSRFPSNQMTTPPQLQSNQTATPPSTRPSISVQPSEQSVESKIISFLQNQQQPCKTSNIRMSLGAKTKKEINQVLYAMQRKGVITKVVEMPPTWKLCPGKGLSDTTGNSSPSSQSFGQGYQTPKISQMPAQTPPSQPSVGTTQPKQSAGATSSSGKEFFEACFTSINKNPVSALNNYAQKNKSEATFEIISQKTIGKPSFTVAAKLGNRRFTAVTAGNMKEAKRQAADVALREMGQVATAPDTMDGKVDLSNLPSIPQDNSWTHFDRMAALSHQLFSRIAPTVSASFAGRKVIACMIMKTSEQDPGTVLSLGAGNRCITGQRISLEGKKVNDSHAEIVARRGLIRVLYKELSKCIAGKDSIFKSKPVKGAKLSLKDGVTFHLYISTAPCGDGALFSPREAGSVAAEEGSMSRQHKPTFTSKQQGILRTKIEDGEGTLPIDSHAPPQTWDGLLQGERLRTMSCSDKICRWNVLGLQGALLSHFMEPIYLDSLTLGYLYDHGHLSRAVCCRLQHKDDLNNRLSCGYHVNHPCIGRVTAYDPPRETEKTNNISINWALGDARAEVTDGRDGACLTRTGNAPTPSRLCKAALYGNFRALCRRTSEYQHLLNVETYKEAKKLAGDFSRSKQEMKQQFKASKYSQWVSKPMEQDLFNEHLPALDV